MADMKNKERRSVSHEKVENGYIVTFNREWQTTKGEFKFETKKHIASTAREAKQLMNDLLKV
jgi:hypothetical protein